MRRLASIALLLTACGGNKGKPDDAPVCTGPCDAPAVPSDAMMLATDATPLTPCTPISGTTVKTRKIGTVSGGAILATSPPNDGRLFVIEQAGGIRIFENEVLKPTPFLDVSSLIVAGGEQGLLGLAFHPHYATNGLFYIWYTATNPDTADTANPWVDVLASYTGSTGDPNVADPTSGKIIISIPDFASNHNAGMIEFGADGFLYVSTGDGGSGGDPHRNGQNKNVLLAKILRIDVDHPANGKPYGIPSDNPFATSGGAPEVWIYGVRNPWRWTFDRATGDMWIGDVGQGVTEEVNVLLAGHQAGVNLGWSAFEGTTCCATQADKCTQTPPQQACDTTGIQFAQDMRTHASGWDAVIGGQVYRGACFPDLVGWYFYTDNVFGKLSKAQLQSNGTLMIVNLTGTFPTGPSSIHADSRGELYETDVTGGVWAIEAGP
jgi:glucose/arabinose dehydrogenase